MRPCTQLPNLNGHWQSCSERRKYPASHQAFRKIWAVSLNALRMREATPSLTSPPAACYDVTCQHPGKPTRIAAGDSEEPNE